MFIVLQFVQSLEMFRLLGVSKVFVYKTSCSSKTQRVLNYYTRKGKVEQNHDAFSVCSIQDVLCKFHTERSKQPNLAFLLTDFLPAPFVYWWSDRKLLRMTTVSPYKPFFKQETAAVRRLFHFLMETKTNLHLTEDFHSEMIFFPSWAETRILFYDHVASTICAHLLTCYSSLSITHKTHFLSLKWVRSDKTQPTQRI